MYISLCVCDWNRETKEKEEEKEEERERERKRESKREGRRDAEGRESLQLNRIDETCAETLERFLQHMSQNSAHHM